MALYQGKPGSSLMDTMSAAVAEGKGRSTCAPCIAGRDRLTCAPTACVRTATGNPNCKLQAASGGGYSGGGGASTGAAKDASTGAKYFYKSTGMWGLDMLMAEYKGIKVRVHLPCGRGGGPHVCVVSGPVI